MPSIVFTTGWEAGPNAITNNSNTTGEVPAINQYWESVDGTPETTTGRNGSYALRISPASGTAEAATWSPAASTRRLIGSFYFKIGTLNTGGDYRLCSMATSAGGQIFVINTSGNIIAEPAGNAGDRQTGPNVNDGSWHRLDFDSDTSGTQHSIAWQVDGVAQTTATTSDSPGAQDMTAFRFGSTLTTHTNACVFDYDDAVFSYTSADYPLGEYKVLGYSPNSDADISNVGLGAFVDADAVSISGSNPAWNNLNVTDNATWVAQTVTDTGYIEIGFTNTAESVAPDAVQILMTYKAASTSACLIEARVNDSSTIDNFTGSFDPSASATSTRWKCYTNRPAGGAWTTGAFDGLLVRFGYSGDATPDPYVIGFLLEAAYEVGGSKTRTYNIDSLIKKSYLRITTLDFYTVGNRKQSIDARLAPTRTHSVDIYKTTSSLTRTYSMNVYISPGWRRNFIDILKAPTRKHGIDSKLIPERKHYVDSFTEVGAGGPLVGTTYTIASAANPYSLTGNRGPFADTNGNLYVFLRDDANKYELECWKSSDGGQNWTEQNSASKPNANSTGSGIGAVDCFQQGSVIHIISSHRDSSTGAGYYYHTFRTSDNANADTWGTVDEFIISYASQSSEFGVGIFVAQDGDITAVTSGDSSDGSEETQYHYKTGGSWTTDLTLHAPNRDTPAQGVVPGLGNKHYGVAKDEVSGGNERWIFRYFSDVAATPGTAVEINDATPVPTDRNYHMPHPAGVTWDNGSSVGRTMFGFTSEPTNGGLGPFTGYTAYADDGGAASTPIQMSSTSIYINSSVYSGHIISWTLAIDAPEKKVYSLFTSASDGNIYLRTNTNVSGWGAEDTYFADTINAQLLSSNVYERNGYYRLGVMWDDNFVNTTNYGTTKFAEYSIRAVSGTSTETRNHSIDALLRGWRKTSLDTFIVGERKHFLDTFKKSTRTNKVDAYKNPTRKISIDAFRVRVRIGRIDTYTNQEGIATKTRNYTIDSLLNPGRRKYSIDTYKIPLRKHGIDAKISPVRIVRIDTYTEVVQGPATRTREHNIHMYLAPWRRHTFDTYLYRVRIHSIDANIKQLRYMRVVADIGDEAFFVNKIYSGRALKDMKMTYPGVTEKIYTLANTPVTSTATDSQAVPMVLWRPSKLASLMYLSTIIPTNYDVRTGTYTSETSMVPATALPTIVFVDGAYSTEPYTINGRDELIWLHKIIRCGYNVVLANTRGSGGYGPAFASDYSIAHDEVEDLNAVVTWVKTQTSFVDPNRVMVLGKGRGGINVMTLAHVYPSLAKIFGIISSTPHIGGDVLNWPDGTPKTMVSNSFGGSPSSVPNQYIAKSLPYNIADVVRDILFVHGSEDNIYSIRNIYGVHNALNSASKNVTSIAFKGMGTDITDDDNQMMMDEPFGSRNMLHFIEYLEEKLL